VLCVTSSGIAALLLPGGQTVHSTFSIPTQDLANDTSYNIDKNSKQAELMRIVHLIIWDEAAMQH
jgi:ATP-dependent DNA helicase PIF1